MTITEAKEQVKLAIKAYLAKDEFGNYVIPIEKQRPIFLYGSPGIGKTAIIEQIGRELGLGVVTYSMTHHTRQSALGLPTIVTKKYEDKEFLMTEYTMSEIIASVYEVMKKSGNKEGILFLDEINCVSETLAPSMLQFLQYKIFGSHRVPEGWVVVTAGNPPEFNNSVHEFDIVTWDRLKRINIEANFEAWKTYAIGTRVHSAILSYLEVKKANFYKIEESVDGKKFVTVRGWCDLSDMIHTIEKLGEQIDLNLVCQYIQDIDIARDFFAYYKLFNKYKEDYNIKGIIEGSADVEALKEKLLKAKFDERYAVIRLLFDALCDDFYPMFIEQKSIENVFSIIKPLKTLSVDEYSKVILDSIQRIRDANKIENDIETKSINSKTIELLSSLNESFLIEKEPSFTSLVDLFNALVDAYKAKSSKPEEYLINVFNFINDVFSVGNEMLIFVTNLTANKYSYTFILNFGSREYVEFAKLLKFHTREDELLNEIDRLYAEA